MQCLKPSRPRSQVLANDTVHPLIRKKRILLEAYDQVRKILLTYQANDWDTRIYEADMHRLHMRLIQVQMEIEEHDLD